MAELKPCPFCGGNARISADTEATRDSEGRLWAFTAVCDRCCATSGLTFSTDRAIEAWNRRAEDGKPNCKKCRYRIWVARLCDVHVGVDDCDKYGTDLCKKMNDPEFIKFVDEGGLEDGTENH